MIIVFAKAIYKEGKKDEIIGFADDLIKNTRAESGCINYNLYENVQEEHLLFVEQWEDTDALNKHLETEHFINFGKNIDGCLDTDLIIDVYDSNKTEL